MGAGMTPDWIAVDWGTSHLRAFAMGPDGVLDERGSDKGMGKLTREGFEPALAELVCDWLGDAPLQVVICGMAGARQGWSRRRTGFHRGPRRVPSVDRR